MSVANIELHQHADEPPHLCYWMEGRGAEMFRHLEQGWVVLEWVGQDDMTCTDCAIFGADGTAALQRFSEKVYGMSHRARTGGGG